MALSIVDSIIDAPRSRIWAEPNESHGTTILLTPPWHQSVAPL
jgi:signal transduction histidine kinase